MKEIILDILPYIWAIFGFFTVIAGVKISEEKSGLKRVADIILIIIGLNLAIPLLLVVVGAYIIIAVQIIYQTAVQFPGPVGLLTTLVSGFGLWSLIRRRSLVRDSACKWLDRLSSAVHTAKEKIRRLAPNRKVSVLSPVSIKPGYRQYGWMLHSSEDALLERESPVHIWMAE